MAAPAVAHGGRADPPHTAANTAHQPAGQNQQLRDAVQQFGTTAGSAAAAAAPSNFDRSAGELHGPDAFSARAAASHCTETSGAAAHLPSSHTPDAAAATAPAALAAGSAARQDPVQQPADGEAACSSADQTAASDAGAEAGLRQQEPVRHYWGQALQHLDCAAEVEAGSRLTLLARRDGGTVRFNLRVRLGANVGPSTDQPLQPISVSSNSWSSALWLSTFS